MNVQLNKAAQVSNADGFSRRLLSDVNAAAPSVESFDHDAAITVDERAALNASVQQSLDRLEALNLFNVDELVMNLPASVGSCYGLCPGDTEAYDAELARQAGRLEELVEVAESVNSGHRYMFGTASAEEAVKAMNALEIIEVESLVVSEPQNNPACYNTPCASDILAAKRENERRATVAFTIAQYAQDI
jgi:hypothetical protein